MRKKSYNIRYFHGRESFLSEEKSSILESFGNVTSPIFNYKAQGELQHIVESFDEMLPNTILISSSFGGYIASVYSAAYDIPSLFFIPALKYRESEGVLQVPFLNNIVVKTNGRGHRVYNESL